MTINEIAVWVLIAVVSLGFIEHKITALSQTLARLGNQVSSLRMNVSSIEGGSDALRQAINDIDRKVEGLAIAVYGISDRLDQAATQIDDDTEDRLSNTNSLHERLDNIERLINDLRGDINSSHPQAA
jgi:chromosome segregation ATPase